MFSVLAAVKPWPWPSRPAEYGKRSNGPLHLVRIAGTGRPTRQKPSGGYNTMNEPELCIAQMGSDTTVQDQSATAAEIESVLTGHAQVAEAVVVPIFLEQGR